ncbi:Vegetative incompatibility protein HET-E-1 [Colletotrichum siamense]|uniref:Vegetative incompatibility protein HET-E-1 n=1 Tax=Colletotrichum siamense TaxID=690259 RepID=A0A9P5EMW0_COLSI|nr:Vegetative incompatibility protein HET-E-1 [Colletotrichum siamense]KAF4854627.1 Vegetative incompatibility protein HET-E-1 [Colletotrichum siamense]
MFRGPTWKDLVAEIKDLDHRGREPGTLAFQERVHNFIDDSSDAQKQAQHEELQRRRSDILKVLYKCPYEDRKNINPERAPGTCEWFIQHHLFREWKASDQSSLLWVSADPGCGKSVLSRYLVDEVLPTKEKLVTCFFFFKEDFPDQRKASLALCVLLWQLFTKLPLLLSEAIIEKFENAGNPLTESFTSLLQILLTATSESEVPICCLVDALDECQENDRQGFITGLNKFYLRHEERQPLKFIVTSRPELKIQRGFQQLENVWPRIHLRGEDDAQVAKISGEIDIFARIRIQTISESLRLTTAEADFLRSEVMKVHSRTYLWVHMALNVVENMLEFTKTTVQQVLHNIPEGLDRLYEKILSRSQNIAKARKLLQIVLAAPMPLTLEEMSVALSISEEHHYYDEVELVPLDRFKDSIRAICGLFITIVDGRIYFIHQTAKEFLVPKDEQIQVVQPTYLPAEPEPFLWKHTFALEKSHLTLAQICIWYLNLQNDFILMQPLVHGKEEHRQFFRYAARLWHEHLRNSRVNHGNEITAMAAQLCIASCSDTPNPWFWAWLLSLGYLKTTKVQQIISMDQLGIFEHPKRTILLNPTRTRVPDNPTPCIVAAACGLENIVRDMVAGNDNAHLEVDELCRTPLWWAAREGHSEVVRFLLRDTTAPEPDQKPFYITANLFQDGMTLLMVASTHGHLSTVQVLLEDPRICPSVTDLHSETALLHAMRHGEEAVAEALLGRGDALFNLTDNELWKSFDIAVDFGYPYVSALIAKGLPLEFESRFGHSPILFVIDQYRGEKKLGLLKALHRLGTFDMAATDSYKRSAVWLAASSKSSSVEVLEWLVLDLGLDIESSDFQNQTPF